MQGFSATSSNLDFHAVFDSSPALYLLLSPNDPDYTILAANAAYAQATLITPSEVVGRGLFEAFPDNPADPTATGVSNVRASLRRVLASKAPDTMPAQKYDVRRPPEAGGGFEERYWSPVNAPVLDASGGVQYIIHRVEDVTELALLRRDTARGEIPAALRERADRMEAELFLRSHQLAEAQRLDQLRQEAEAKLVNSEARFALAFAGAPIGMVLLTPEGIVLEVNDAFRNMLGYSRAEMEGLDSSHYTYLEDVPETRRVFTELQTANRTLVLEKRYRPKSGGLLWGRASVTLRRDAQGRPAEIIAIIEDVTERKRIEQALRESEERARAAVRANSSLQWTNNARGEMEGEQPGWGAFTGQTREQYQGYGWANAVHPDDAQPSIDAWDRAVAGRRPFVFEHRVRRHDGVWRMFSIRAIPVLDAAGEIREWVGVHNDITEERNLVNALRQSEEKFRQALDSIPQLAWSMRPDGSYDLFNQRWFAYTGQAPQGAEWKGWDWTVHPEEQNEARARWKKSLSAGQPFEGEYRCRRFDGKYCWFLGRATPIRDEAGGIVRWFGTFTDIEEQKRSEAALRQANRELEEVAYVASHDLQEPLRTVGIYTEMILARLPAGDPELAKFGGFVRNGVQRTVALIEDLLSFSKMTHSEAAEDGVAELDVALREATAALARQSEECGTVIRAASLPKVRGDTGQFSHVFQNLLSNSLKYRQPDRTPEIEISAVPEGSRWVISFRDNGIGFEQEYARRIFGLFKRLHGNEYPGTGLGLAICKRVIERYSGSVWAESQPGVGTTIRFSLPGAESQPTGR